MAYVRAFQPLVSARHLMRTVRIDVPITSRPGILRCIHKKCPGARSFTSGRSLQQPPKPKKIPKAKANSPAKDTPSSRISPSSTGNASRPTPSQSTTPSSESKTLSVPKQPTRISAGPKTSEAQPASKTGSFKHAQSVLQTRLETLFRSGDTVLLYRSRDTNAFTFWSFLIGATMLTGAAFTFKLIFLDSRERGVRTSLLVLAPETAIIGVFLWMGCAIVYAPIKVVKSVTALANRGGPLMEARPTLVFEMSPLLPGLSLLPGMKKTFEVAPQDVFLDRKLVTLETNWDSVPLSKAALFTREYYTPASSRLGIGQRLVAFNRSLVDIWPASKVAIRQMAWRAGFARVYCKGHGIWKLNMERAELLDGGLPLKLLSMEREEDRQRTYADYLQGIWAWLRSKLS